MKRSSPPRLKGKWRIVEMPTWPVDHLDLVGHAYIKFNGSSHGELAFGALTATLDCSTTPNGVDFEWHGFDEMDEVTGDGWVELQTDGSLIGEFAYDNGDESTFEPACQRRSDDLPDRRELPSSASFYPRPREGDD